MPNQVIFFELTRPNAEVPWAHEYIISVTEQELNDVRVQYYHLREQADGRNNWQSEYVETDNPHVLLLKFTYFNTTSESVNHLALLHYKKLMPEIDKWEKWNTEYNKMWGITRTKMDAHNTPKNSILNYGDYGRVETFGLKFQNQ